MSRREDGGQASVELALALPLVALLLLAVVQVGLIMRGQVMVTHAAREAARAAAVGEPEVEVARTAKGSGGLLALRLDVDIVEVDDRVRVELSYAQPTDVPIVGALFGDVTLTADATMKREDTG